MKRAWIPLALAGTLAAMLAACGQGADRAPSDADVLRAEALRPADPALAAKYERSCLNCHGVRGGAPLVGFAAAWAPRLAQGTSTLLSHAREGYNAMPPKGQCNDCSDEELQQLTHFMSQAQ